MLTLAGMQGKYQFHTALMLASCNEMPGVVETGNEMPGVVEKLLAAGARADLRNVRPLNPFCFPPTRQCPPTTLPLAVLCACSGHIRAKLAPTSVPDMLLFLLHRNTAKPHSKWLS